MGSHRLLLVDEYTLSRVVLTTAFRIKGHTCKAVTDAAAALAAIETFRPTVIILEWFFRDRSGIGLSAILRTRSESFGRPLVVMAVSAQDEPEGFRHQESVDDYIVKPVSVERILNAIECHGPVGNP